MRSSRTLVLGVLVLCFQGVGTRPVLGGFKLETLANFGVSNGNQPFAGVIVDAQGNIYGTTKQGGANGLGTVYEIAAKTGVLSTIASFNNTNGELPQGGLVMDSQGNIYGTTVGGGAYGGGTVFKIAAGTGILSTVASFNGTNGSYPQGALTVDSQGNLYGTTTTGGTNGTGTAFKIAAGTGAITTLTSFVGTNGTNPNGGLVMDGSGNLYGTTNGGGANGRGTVFEIAAGTNTFSTLASFNGTNGAEPLGSLTLDSHGNIYGTTYGGGANGQGTVFEIAAKTDALSTIASFNGGDGSGSYAGLVIDGQGNIYGTTYDGTYLGGGTIFEIAAGTSNLSTLVMFNNTNGYFPQGSLTISPQGNIYGTTQHGGSLGGGTVFELVNPAAVPEPSSIVMSAIGLMIGLGYFRYRCKR